MVFSAARTAGAEDGSEAKSKSRKEGEEERGSN